MRLVVDGEDGVDVELEDVNGVRGIGCRIGVGSGDESRLPIDGLGESACGSSTITGIITKNDSLIIHFTSTEFWSCVRYFYCNSSSYLQIDVLKSEDWCEGTSSEKPISDKSIARG